MNYPQGPGPYPPPQHGQPHRPSYQPAPPGQYQSPPPVYRPPQGPYQPHPQAPAYPPQQPANVQPYAPQGYGQPTEGIAVNTQFFPLSFMLLLFKPKIRVDGYEAPATGWGRSVVPARPGP